MRKTVLEVKFKTEDVANSYFNMISNLPLVDPVKTDGLSLKINFGGEIKDTDHPLVTYLVLLALNFNCIESNAYVLDDPPDSKSSELAEKDAIIAKLEQQIKGLIADCKGMEAIINSLHDKNNKIIDILTSPTL